MIVLLEPDMDKPIIDAEKSAPEIAKEAVGGTRSMLSSGRARMLHPKAPETASRTVRTAAGAVA
jgi:hypothetical protein